MIRFEMYEILPRDVVDKLWDQNVNMDDWDYLLFVEEEFKDHFYETEGSDYARGNWCPNSWQVERLLQGCCANGWYATSDFKGKKGFVGIAYHA